MVKTITTTDPFNKNLNVTSAGYENKDSSSSTSSNSSNSTNSTTNQIILADPYFWISPNFQVPTTSLSLAFQTSFQFDLYISSIGFETQGGSAQFYLNTNGSNLIVNQQASGTAGSIFNSANFTLPTNYFVYLPKNTPILVFAYSQTTGVTMHFSIVALKSLS